MGMVAAKCSQCGAPIEVDSGRKDGFCPFCGTKYVTEEIIHKTVVNQTITNRIETAVIQNGDSFDMLYERFAAFVHSPPYSAMQFRSHCTAMWRRARVYNLFCGFCGYNIVILSDKTALCAVLCFLSIKILFQH